MFIDGGGRCGIGVHPLSKTQRQSRNGDVGHRPAAYRAVWSWWEVAAVGGGGGEWGDAREQCPARKCVSKAPCDWWISGDSTEPSVINTRASAAAAATAAVGRALSACPIEAMAFLCSCHFRKPSSRLMAREKLSSPTHSCLSFMALFTTLLSLPTEISSSH